MYKEIQIFDLDGVLICSLHRYRTLPCGERIDLDYWRENTTPEKIAQDSLLPLANFYKECLENPAVYVIVATSRVMQKAGFDFIAENLGMPNKFIHRQGDNDQRRGYDLKVKPIRPLKNLKQFQNAVLHIWEDNKEQLDIMCEMLDAIGHYIPSRQGH
jgi:hypothetical protein